MTALIDNPFSTRLVLCLGGSLSPGMRSPLERLIAARLAARKDSLWVRAICANQQVLSGGRLTQAELDEIVRDVLYQTVYYTFDLFRYVRRAARFAERLPTTPEMHALIERSRAKRGGAMMVMPHMSNFDLALAAWAQRGMDAQLISHGSPHFVYRFQNRVRTSMGLLVTPASDVVGAQAVARMREGGFVITAVDRPLEAKRRTLDFCGRPSPLPTGHVRMALAAGVPVIVFALHMLPDGRYRMFVSDPIPMRDGPDPVATTRRNAEAVLDIVADIVRQAPRQWMMLYPVWPDAPESRPYLEGG